MAKVYRDFRKNPSAVRIDNQSIPDYYQTLERRANSLPPEQAQPLYEQMAFVEELGFGTSFDDALKQIHDEPTRAWAESMRERVTPVGRTYEVNLHVKPDELLDWDKPLSEQPAILEKLRRADQADATHVFTPEGAIPIEDVTGEDLYRTFSSVRGADVTSRAATRVGIKGHSFLDQGSRAAGEGTRNIVMYPGTEHLIEIAKKYGIPLATVQAAYAAYQRDQQQVPLAALGNK